MLAIHFALQFGQIKEQRRVFIFIFFRHFIDKKRMPHNPIESLIRLLNDPSLCRQFGQQARVIVRARFSAQLAARKTHDLYLALAGL